MKDEHKEYLALALLAVALMAVGGFIVFIASELAKPNI